MGEYIDNLKGATGGRPPGKTRRSGKRIGKPAWFRAMFAGQAVRAALGRVLTSRIAEEVFPDNKQLRWNLAKAFPTALELTLADWEEVARVKGLGPLRARRLHAYLLEKEARVAWSVPESYRVR